MGGSTFLGNMVVLALKSISNLKRRASRQKRKQRKAQRGCNCKCRFKTHSCGHGHWHTAAFNMHYTELRDVKDGAYKTQVDSLCKRQTGKVKHWQGNQMLAEQRGGLIFSWEKDHNRRGQLSHEELSEKKQGRGCISFSLTEHFIFSPNTLHTR